MLERSPWAEVLPPETVELGDLLAEKAEEQRRRGKTIFPPQESIFRAMEITPPQKVKACVIGQDPYHEQGQANGLAFSVNPGTPIPRSLKNIFKELQSDIGCKAPSSGDLTPWAEQGVLLLNTVLTVQEGNANSHAQWGWQAFTLEVFRACTKQPQPIVFILWGGQARAFLAGLQLSSLLDQKKACIWSSHPSPLGATKGNTVVPAFLGSKPFSKTNDLLIQMESDPIDWILP